MSATILAAFLTTISVAFLVALHGIRWQREQRAKNDAYAARLTSRLERIREDHDYGRLRALAEAPYDHEHRHALGDAMLLATVHAMDVAYGERREVAG